MNDYLKENKKLFWKKRYIDTERLFCLTSKSKFDKSSEIICNKRLKFVLQRADWG